MDTRIILTLIMALAFVAAHTTARAASAAHVHPRLAVFVANCVFVAVASVAIALASRWSF
jgi:hypothetical protein